MTSTAIPQECPVCGASMRAEVTLDAQARPTHAVWRCPDCTYAFTDREVAA